MIGLVDEWMVGIELKGTPEMYDVMKIMCKSFFQIFHSILCLCPSYASIYPSNHPVIHRTIQMHVCVILFTGVIAFAQVSSPEPAAPAASAPAAASPVESWKWKPDYYRALVIYNAENPVESDEGVKAIQAKTEDRIKSPNLSLRKVDLTDKAKIDAKTAEVLKILAPGKLPFTMIYFPGNSEVENPLWTGRMTPEEADMISDSPARREMARRLLKGESVVWLLIESGIEYKDYRILKLLTEEIKTAGTGTPGAETPVLPESDVKKEGNKAKSQIKMSIIRISREDVAEKILLNILNGIEPEIMNVSNEPVLVPIYGRGRIFKLFPDDEINWENIRNTIESCSGKSAGSEKGPNSGAALLLSVNWDAFADGKLSVDVELPALRTYSDNFSLEDVFPVENSPVPDSALVSAAAVKEQEAAARPPVPMMIINIILVSVIGSLIFLFVVVVLRARK